MNLYKHHTERELLAVLEQSPKLTYEAQLNLHKELQKRSLGVSTVDLEAHIHKKKEAITNFEHLEDLGFAIEEDASTGSIHLSRAMKAKLIDGAAILLGTLLFLAGVVHFWLLIAVFFGDNEFTLTKLFTYTLLITAGVIGFKMLGGVHRFLDYHSFSLVQSGSEVRIKKGGLEGEQVIPVEQLHLREATEGELIFGAGDIEIMRAAQDNLVYKHTLEALLHKLRTN